MSHILNCYDFLYNISKPRKCLKFFIIHNFWPIKHLFLIFLKNVGCEKQRKLLKQAYLLFLTLDDFCLIKFMQQILAICALYKVEKSETYLVLNLDNYPYHWPLRRTRWPIGHWSRAILTWIPMILIGKSWHSLWPLLTLRSHRSALMHHWLLQRKIK